MWRGLQPLGYFKKSVVFEYLFPVMVRGSWICHSTEGLPDVTDKDENLKTSYDVIVVGAGHNGLVAVCKRRW